MTLDECTPGMLATWLHAPRDGYGYIVPMRARVVSVGKKLVRIAITPRASEGVAEEVIRNVDPASLRPMTAQVAPPTPEDPATHNRAVRHLMNVITQNLMRYTFTAPHEADLQRQVFDALALIVSGTGLQPAREIVTGGGKYDITLIDVMNEARVDRLVRPAQLVLELKLKASASEVERQAQRYAKQPEVDAVMVVSTSLVLLSKLVSGTLGGKPFGIIALRTF